MLSAFSRCQPAQLFFMAAYPGGEGVERSAKRGDLVGEASESAAGGGAAAVRLDDGAGGGVAVEGGAAQAGSEGDGGEGDGLSVVTELRAGAFDAVEGAGVGHPACAAWMRVSSWAMSRRCRSASVIQPRCSASRASASASTRWAASIGRELGSAWKLGQCSQMLA